MTAKTISGEAFDAKFDAGEDVSDHIDWSTAHRPGASPEAEPREMFSPMDARDLLARIVVEPGKMGGKPVIRGGA